VHGNIITISVVISFFVLLGPCPAAAGEPVPDLKSVFEHLRGNAAEITDYTEKLENCRTIRNTAFRLESEDRIISSEAHAELIGLGAQALPACFALGLLGLDFSAGEAYHSEAGAFPALLEVAEEIADNIPTEELLAALGRLRNTPFDRLILGSLSKRKENPRVHALFADVFENGSVIHQNRACLKLAPQYARYFVPELIKLTALGEINDPEFMFGAAGRSDMQPIATDLLLRVANANVPALTLGLEHNSSFARGRCAAALKYITTSHEVIPSLVELLNDTETGSFGSMGKPIPVGRLAGESLEKLAGIPDERFRPPGIMPIFKRHDYENILRKNPLLLAAKASICAELWKRWYQMYSGVLFYDANRGRFVIPPEDIVPGAVKNRSKFELRRMAFELLESEERISLAEGLLLLNSSATIKDFDKLRDIAAGNDIELAAIAFEVIWSVFGKAETSIYLNLILDANELLSAAAVRFYMDKIGPLPSKSMERILSIGKVPAKIEILNLIAEHAEHKGLLPKVMDLLIDENAPVRAKACEVLTIMPYPEAKPHLLSNLDDASPAVRGMAALALAQLGADAEVFKAITGRMEQESDPIAFFKIIDAMIEIDNAASAKILVEFRRRPEYQREFDEGMRLRLEKLSGVDLYDDDLKLIFGGSMQEALDAARHISKYAPERIKSRVREMLISRREPTVRAGIFLAAELRLRNLTPQIWSLIGAAKGRLTEDICLFAEKAGGYDLVEKIIVSLKDGTLPRRQALIALDNILGFGWTGTSGQFDVRSLGRRFERWWIDNSNSKEPLQPVPDWFRQGCEAKIALFRSTNEELRRNAAKMWAEFFERHVGSKVSLPDDTPESTVRSIWGDWWGRHKGKLKFSTKRRILVKSSR
jgi:hypothetical protein